MNADSPVQSLYVTAVSFYFILSQIIPLAAFCWFVLENLMRTTLYMPRILILFAKLLRKFKIPHPCSGKRKRVDSKDNKSSNKGNQVEKKSEGAKTNSPSENDWKNESENIQGASVSVENEKKEGNRAAAEDKKLDKFDDTHDKHSDVS